MDKAQLEELIRQAFEKGVQWAETYKGWYEPTVEQTEKVIQIAINELL